jgi:hypothetical protein
MTVLKSDITQAAGVSQVCAGHPSGCETAIHALRKVFASMSTDTVLLIDADNAFNRLNRAVALHNIRYTCPPLATILTNIYRAPSRLFVTGGMVLSSEEGTTHTVHGDVRPECHAIDQQMPECAIHRRPSQSSASVVCR